jgi:cell wall-associated NlpC family hydrolase
MAKAKRRPRSIGDAIAAEARTWVDTPVIWGQSQKGQGADCKGLVAGVARAVGRPEGDSVHARFSAYRPDRRVPAQQLQAGLADLFDRVDLAADIIRDGDVLLFEVEGVPQHLAIASCGATRAVHADGWMARRVRERDLAAMRRMYRLNSAWRWKAGA